MEENVCEVSGRARGLLELVDLAARPRDLVDRLPRPCVAEDEQCAGAVRRQPDLQGPIVGAGGFLCRSIDPVQVLVEPPRAEGRLRQERHGRSGEVRSRTQEVDCLSDLRVAFGVVTRLAEKATEMQAELATDAGRKRLLVEQRSHDVGGLFLREGVEGPDQELDRKLGSLDRRERLDIERLPEEPVGRHRVVERPRAISSRLCVVRPLLRPARRSVVVGQSGERLGPLLLQRLGGPQV